MRCYLLKDHKSDTLHLAFGADPVAAAESLIKAIGGNPDVERFSVSGGYDCDPAKPIDVTKWWPHFTCQGVG